MTGVVEVVTFRLAEGFTEMDVAKTCEGVNTLLETQAGFQYRSQSHDGKGNWFDIIYWENMQAAHAGSAVFMEHPAGKALCTLIDENTCVVRHMPVLTSTMACEASNQSA